MHRTFRNMAIFMSILYLILVLTTGEILSNEIIVSQENTSEDAPGCGSSSKPCRTIQYAFQNVAVDCDTILIDGGCDSYKYEFKSTLTIDKNITFSAFETQKICNYPLLVGIYAVIFLVTAPLTNIIAIRFGTTQIDYSAFLVNSTLNKLTVKVMDCHFYDRGPITQGYWSTAHDQIVMFSGCTFSNIWCQEHSESLSLNQSTKIYQSKTNKITRKVINLDNCVVENSDMDISICFGDFTIFEMTRSTFVNSPFKLIFNNNYYLQISNSVFNQSGGQLHHAGNATFDKVEFLLSALSVYGTCLTIKRSRIDCDSTFDTEASNVTIKNTTISHVRPIKLMTLNHANITFKNLVLVGKNSLDDYHVISMEYYFIDTGSISLTQNSQFTFIDSQFFSTAPGLTMEYACRVGNLPDFSFKPDLSFLSLFCRTIGSSKYSLVPATISWNNTERNFDRQNHKLLSCPFEGICADGKIRNKDAYWGYTSKHHFYNNTAVNFVLCPELYCCEFQSDNCQSYHSCGANREGRLCGECTIDTKLQLFGMKECSDCKDDTFWLVYFSLPVFLLILYCFGMTSIEKLTKTLFKQNENNLPNENHDEIHYQRQNQPQENDEKHYLLGEDPGRVTPIENFDEQPNIQNIKANETSLSLQGIMWIFLTFYQIVYIMKVRSHFKVNLLPWMSTFIDLLMIPFTFTVDVVSNDLFPCASFTRNATVNEMIKVGPLILCIVGILVALIIINVVKLIKGLHAAEQYLNIDEHRMFDTVPIDIPQEFKGIASKTMMLKDTYLSLLIAGYLPVTIFLLRITNCISIDGVDYQYIQASVECYSAGQKAAIAMLVLWSVPFPLSLYAGTKLLRECRINPNFFITILTFPPAFLWYVIISKYRRHRVHQLRRQGAIFACQLIKTVNEPFRIIQSNENDGRYLSWQPMICFRGFLFAVISVDIKYPVVKIMVMTLLLSLSMLFDVYMQPFQSKELNYINFTSSVALFLLLPINLFWGASSVFDFNDSSFMHAFGLILLTIEFIVVISPLAVSLFVFIFRLCKILFLKQRA